MKTRNEVKPVRRTTGMFASIAFALLGLLLTPAAQAQSAGNEMCGDGTTFTVVLSGGSSVDLPDGCRIYAFFVSGYGRNRNLDEIVFYKVAEFVAQNNGYVHVSWWNNVLRPYLAGPVPTPTIPVPLPDPTDLSLTSVGPTPGGFHSLQGDHFAPTILGTPPVLGIPGIPLPKANPEEDDVFRQDLRLMILAIRAHNPTALVVLAGHSMGGTSVAALAEIRDVPIDLLAVIDPLGNRTSPVGRFGFQDYNWTRWRAVQSVFRGYKKVDCVRDPNFFNLCKDFDPNLFRISFQCTTSGGFLNMAPFPPSLAPTVCGGPYVDPGVRRSFGSNVGRLYHRWQTEFSPFPKDNQRAEAFGHYAPRSVSTFLQGSNYQHPFPTCRSGSDPWIPALRCLDDDGHGELVGYRVSLIPDGLRMLNWPTDAAGRRQKLLELPTASPSWPHRPVEPNRCLVCDDMIAIIENLMAHQPPPLTDMTPPSTVATALPGPNRNGWNNEDVVITLQATDNAGGTGVKEIEHSVSGASPSSTMVTAGNTAQETITTEGASTLTFFARDNASNVESEKSLAVNLDKTPPSIEAVPNPPPNAFGWNKSDVTVSFTASDALSGLAGFSPTEPVLVATEGADQEIIGTATDLADNQSSSAAVVSLDKTAPEVTGTPDRAPDSNSWYNHLLTVTWDCADGLSGVQSFSAPSDYNGPDSAFAMVNGTCFDFAENEGSANFDFQFDATPPRINIATPADGAAFLLNAAVNSAYDCTDNLSGVESCVSPVANGAALDTATVNDKQFTVDSSDVAANHASRTHSYSVHYAFSGFANPIGPMPMVNVAKAGRTVPIKYYLQDAGGAFISDLASFTSLLSAPVACDSSAPGVLAEETDAAGSTAIRYDAATNQFIYNWKTDASWAGTCRALQLTLNDGTQHLALFRFQ